MKERKTFEHKIGERVFHFVCDNDSPLIEVKDSLCYFITHMVNFEQSVIKRIQDEKDLENQEKSPEENGLE